MKQNTIPDSWRYMAKCLAGCQDRGDLEEILRAGAVKEALNERC